MAGLCLTIIRTIGRLFRSTAERRRVQTSILGRSSLLVPSLLVPRPCFRSLYSVIYRVHGGAVWMFGRTSGGKRSGSWKSYQECNSVLTHTP